MRVTLEAYRHAAVTLARAIATLEDSGWVFTNEEVRRASDLINVTRDEDIDTSYAEIVSERDRLASASARKDQVLGW